MGYCASASPVFGYSTASAPAPNPAGPEVAVPVVPGVAVDSSLPGANTSAVLVGAHSHAVLLSALGLCSAVQHGS